MDVKEIIIKVKNKDNESMKLLYERYYNQVYYFAFKILKNEENAKDVVQETFINVFKYIDTLKDEEKFKSWLSKIVINCCNKKYLKANKEILIDKYTDYGMHYVIETKDKEIDNQIELKEDQKLVLNLIDNLSDKKKEVILLFYYNEFKINEIAEILECSEGTIKSRLNSSKKDLKKMLEINKYTYKAYSISLPVLLLCLKNESSNMKIDSDISIELLNNIFNSLNHEIIDWKSYISKINKGINDFVINGPVNEFCQVIGSSLLIVMIGVQFNYNDEISTIKKNESVEINKLNIDNGNLIEIKQKDESKIDNVNSKELDYKDTMVVYNSDISSEEVPTIKIKIPSSIEFDSKNKVRDISIELISDELFNGKIEVGIKSDNEYRLVKDKNNFLRYSITYDNILMNSEYENIVILDNVSKEKKGIATLEDKVTKVGIYEDVLNYNIEIIK